MYTKESFIEELVNNASSYIPESGISLERKHIKRSDRDYNGIIIHSKRKIAPIVDEDKVYSHFAVEGESMETALKKTGWYLASALKKAEEKNKMAEVVTDKLAYYDDIRSYIYPVALSGKRAKELGLPYKKMYDIAVICKVFIDKHSDAESMQIPVKKEMLDLWVRNIDEVLDDAFKNMLHGSVSFSPLGDVLSDLENGFGDGEEPENAEDASPLWMLSNKQRLYGAALFLVPSLERQIGKKLGKSYFVLPSSIHEILILPDDGTYNVKSLSDLVQEVNRTQLRPEEVLSDNVYYYDIEKESLQILNE